MATKQEIFETTDVNEQADISEQAYFDLHFDGVVKAGVELAFETMTAAGIKAESAYYESLHEAINREHHRSKKLYEMNSTISTPLSMAVIFTTMLVFLCCSRSWKASTLT